MKKFTRILAILLAVALCSIAFVACDNGKDDGTKGTIAVVAKGETHAF